MIERYLHVQMDGQLLHSPVAPVEANGHTFVPLREIFQALGATVSYNKAQHAITATRGSDTMRINLPEDAATANGARKSFAGGVLPFVRNGVTMVPLRVISEKAGAKVHYNPRPTTPLISITNKTS